MQRRSRFDLSRRRLIQGLGLGAAAGPLLPLLNADAQTAPRPKRLLLIFTPDGAPALNFNTTIDWKPTGTEAAFMTEWGYDRSDPASWGTALQTTIDGNGASWTAWVTDNAWTPSMLCDDFAGCKSGYPVKVCTFNGGHGLPPGSASWMWTFITQF